MSQAHKVVIVIVNVLFKIPLSISLGSGKWLKTIIDFLTQVAHQTRIDLSDCTI